jgi:RNA polymerase sigma-70 factor (ECF subfamily)
MKGRLLPFRRAHHRAEVTDQDLVIGSARGDMSALEELFARHGDRVYRLLVRLRGVDAKDLEDLVQATFLEVQRSAQRFDNRAAVGTWILGIALNLRRHHLRSESRRRSVLTGLAPLLSPREQPDPHEQVAHKQHLEMLEAGIAALPEHLRVVLTLLDLEGLKGREVARILGLPEGTIWRKLHEARLLLRAFVDDEGRP